MSFGWSAGDIVKALELLKTAYVALKDCGGASSDYQEAASFLECLTITLRHVHDLQLSPLVPDISANIVDHSNQIRPPLEAFLERVKSDFGPSLGPASSTWTLRLRAAPAKLRWAFSTSKKVRALREKIELPLTALQLAISQNILQSTLQLPSEIQLRVARSIDFANSKLLPQIQKTLRESDASLRDQLDTLTTAIRSIEANGGASNSQACQQLSRIEGHVLQIHHGLDQVLMSNSHHQESMAPLAALTADVISRHRQESEVQKALIHCNVARSHTDAEITHGKLETMQSLLNSMGAFLSNIPNAKARFDESLGGDGDRLPVEELKRDLLSLFVTLWKIICNFVHILGPPLLVCCQAIIWPILQPAMALRLLISAYNGVTLEDALGQIHILNINVLGSMEMLHRTLRCWFDGCAGEKYVESGFYLLLNARKPGQIITPDLWQQVIQPGAHLNMSMIVKYSTTKSTSCPRCGVDINVRNINLMMTCPGCNLQYAQNDEDDLGKRQDALATAFLDIWRRNRSRHLSTPDNLRGKGNSGTTSKPTTPSIRGTQQASRDPRDGDEHHGQDVARFKRIHFIRESMNTEQQHEDQHSERETIMELWLRLGEVRRQNLAKIMGILAERRLQPEAELQGGRIGGDNNKAQGGFDENDEHDVECRSGGDDDYLEWDDSYEEDDDFNEDYYMADQRRIEEEQRMFHIFAARTFAQSVLSAYRTEIQQSKWEGTAPRQT